MERNNGDCSIDAHLESEDRGKLNWFILKNCSWRCKIWAEFICYFWIYLGGDLSYVLVNPKDANSCQKSYLQVIE